MFTAWHTLVENYTVALIIRDLISGVLSYYSVYNLKRKCSENLLSRNNIKTHIHTVQVFRNYYGS